MFFCSTHHFSNAVIYFFLNYRNISIWTERKLPFIEQLPLVLFRWRKRISKTTQLIHTTNIIMAYYLRKRLWFAALYACVHSKQKLISLLQLICNLTRESFPVQLLIWAKDLTKQLQRCRKIIHYNMYGPSNIFVCLIKRWLIKIAYTLLGWHILTPGSIWSR